MICRERTFIVTLYWQTKQGICLNGHCELPHMHVSMKTFLALRGRLVQNEFYLHDLCKCSIRATDQKFQRPPRRSLLGRCSLGLLPYRAAGMYSNINRTSAIGNTFCQLIPCFKF